MGLPGKRSRRLVGRTLRRQSVKRGVLGDRTVWRWVFYVIAARRIGRKVLGKDAEDLGIEKLQPGQSVVIQAIDPRVVRKETRRERRQRRRTGTVAAK